MCFEQRREYSFQVIYSCRFTSQGVFTIPGDWRWLSEEQRSRGRCEEEEEEAWSPVWQQLMAAWGWNMLQHASVQLEVWLSHINSSSRRNSHLVTEKMTAGASFRTPVDTVSTCSLKEALGSSIHQLSCQILKWRKTLLFSDSSCFKFWCHFLIRLPL